ncbi:tRNA glutamyl-Q(34) synthetase GluQRS [Acidaminobacter hydrogenoformans]|uniref:Glutamyl-tRNA synthetase n=1 Tax=Acidaminobacter hydrogenoformans DSM 2784 TaxID=1120920 RepID=A0A1G5RZD0_9FIRM|nr:tRNA glutamyl-Q(34) synthetase GluQRS [Acidaminobacter hydrogenoformans]SCZ79297.1 glutamyl-tRNA synthetase [Acidaminobacter hydrogenoformans DSM 2784]
MYKRSLPVGRFAPSPTGRMHFGNIWAALLAWLSTRSEGGTMILRMEDLDPDRSKKSFGDQLMKDLIWLGLDWDEGPDAGGDYGPYIQNERQNLYQSAFEKLVECGRAYPCFCSREERTAASAPHRGETTGIPEDPCLLMPESQRQVALQTRRHTWRLNNEHEEIVFTDLNYGEQRHQLDMARDHVVLRRSDGVFAYPLAVVVDDGAMGVTQVVRGSDLLDSTAVQLYLMDLLGYPRPAYGHVPLLVDAQGHRLSKRQKSMDLGAMMASGWTPEQLIGYLGFRAGFTKVLEPVRAADLVGVFDWKTIGKEDVVIDEEDLASARDLMRGKAGR